MSYFELLICFVAQLTRLFARFEIALDVSDPTQSAAYEDRVHEVGWISDGDKRSLPAVVL